MIVKGLKHVMPVRAELLYPGKRRLKGDFTVFYSYFKGSHKAGRLKLFLVVAENITTDHRWWLTEVKLDVKKNIFIKIVEQHWTRTERGSGISVLGGFHHLAREGHG